VEDIDEIVGVAPRWILTAELSNPESDSDVTTSCYVILADTKQERDIGLGRNFNQRVLGIGESFVSASALRVLGIDTNQGERVNLSIDIYDSLITADVVDSDETDRR